MRKILVWLCLAVVASVGVTATTCYFVMDNQNTEQSQPTIEPVEQVVAIFELDGEIDNAKSNNNWLPRQWKNNLCGKIE